MNQKMVIIAGSVLFMTLNGCATQVHYVATADPFKKSVKVVCVSEKDVLTEETAQGLEGNNLAIDSINRARTKCKQAKPQPAK